MTTQRQRKGRFAVDDEAGTEPVSSGGHSPPGNIASHHQDYNNNNNNTNELSKDTSGLALAPANYDVADDLEPSDMNRWQQQTVPESQEEVDNEEPMAYPDDDNGEPMAYPDDDDGDTQPGAVPVHGDNPDDEGTVLVGDSSVTPAAASSPSRQPPPPPPGQQEDLVQAEVAPDLEKAINEAVHQAEQRHQKQCWKIISFVSLGFNFVLIIVLICSLVFLFRSSGNAETETASAPISTPTPTAQVTPEFVPEDPQDCCSNPSLPGCTTKSNYLGCENVIQFNGNYYRTRDCHDPCDMIETCDRDGGTLPSGWTIAPNGTDTAYVGGSYTWGTRVVVFGSVGGPGSLGTTNAKTPFGTCPSCDGNFFVEETSPGFYKPNTCNIRILLIGW